MVSRPGAALQHVRSRPAVEQGGLAAVAALQDVRSRPAVEHGVAAGVPQHVVPVSARRRSRPDGHPVRARAGVDPHAPRALVAHVEDVVAVPERRRDQLAPSALHTVAPAGAAQRTVAGATASHPAPATSAAPASVMVSTRPSGDSASTARFASPAAAA